MGIDHAREQRRRLQLETLVGFLGFFTVIAVIQAVLNAFSPDPAAWPSLLAFGMIALTVMAWRAWRR